MEVIFPYPCNPSVDAVGGGIRYVLTLASHLGREGVDVHVLGCEAGNGRGNGHDAGDFRFTPISKRWEWWHFLRRLWRLVRRGEYFHPGALLHAQHPLFLAPFRGARDRVGPQVCTFHGVPFRGERSNHRRLHRVLERVYRTVERTLLERADHAIFVDSGTVAAMGERVRVLEPRSSVIPNGVDTNAFFPDRKPDALDRWNVEKPYVMFSGRLSTQKNLPLLLAAMKFVGEELGEDGPALVITGQGEEEAELRRQVEQNRGIDVRHLGSLPQQDYRALLSQAEAFVQASLYEASPLAIREALACGTPVATTETGDVASFVDPSVGRIALPTPQGLGRAVADLLAHVGPAMRTRCREVALERLSVVAQVQSTLGVYTRLLT
jgi:glycosyltransferase involved in cell wall biosynthesis